MMAQAKAADPGQWNSVGAKWHLIGAPLRPAALDVALYQRAIDEIAERMKLREALILGVTPELHGLGWPEGTIVRALDRSRDMIDRVWPGSPDLATEGQWTAPPFVDGQFQLALCDGGLMLLDAEGRQQMADQLARILVPGGQAVFRLFLPPDERETPDEVMDALAAGRVANMNCLKLRLGPALESPPGEGVVLGELWQYLADRIADRDAYFGRLGWDRDEVAMVDFYRGSSARYYFITLDEVKALFEAGGAFRCLGVDRPAHLMGDRCAHIRFERA